MPPNAWSCSPTGRPDAAASEVIGSILMIAITVAVAAGLFTVVYSSVPEDDDKLRATLSGSLHENADGWDSGDETVTVTHKGGDRIEIDELAIVVEVEGDATRYTEGGSDPLDHSGEDAFSSGDTDFTIGETWESTDLTVPTEARVSLTVVDTQSGNVVSSAAFRSGTNGCDSDTDPPTVASWTQDPSDIDTDTTGDVTITAELTDNCGVDTTQNPHLHYRINAGSDPSFNDTGAMAHQDGTTWEGTIPDPTWADHGGKTLEYKLVDMADENGNTGESEVQDDLIETISYVQTPLGMVTGTSSNDDNARSADDGDAVATLSEADSTTSSTDEFFGSSSSGTASNPSNAEGSPDDTYATMDADGEDVTVTDFGSGSGTITQVEIALEGHHDGGTDRGQTDVVELSHDKGSTTDTFELTTSDTQHFLDITSDEADWTWTEIENLGVTATCDCHDNPNDARVFSIDAVWVRVTAEETTWSLETDRWTFDALGSGNTHELELRYRTTTAETYEVQVWDGSTWNTQSPTLDQSSLTEWSQTLTSGEVDAGPEIRILDSGVDDANQGELELDYVRVVSS